jgi:4-hydroxy-tetrahydrodipicolinate reductase
LVFFGVVCYFIEKTVHSYNLSEKGGFDMMKICLSGVGRAGKEVARYLLSQQDIEIVAAISRPGGDKIGRDLGEILDTTSTGIIVENPENLEQVVFLSKPEVVIDFSTADAALQNARIFSKRNVNIVMCTTGFTDLAIKQLAMLTARYSNGIVLAPNITLGINVVMLLSNLSARLLGEYDFEITEIHHNQKKDCPSATAVKIANEIEDGLKMSGTEKCENYNVPISSVRSGGIVGIHKVLMGGENETIEITHQSISRRAFAEGALKAARFVRGKSGFFEMSDVLDLKKVIMDYLAEDEDMNLLYQ